MKNLTRIILLSLAMLGIVEGRPAVQDEATLLANLRSQEWKERALAVKTLKKNPENANTWGLREELRQLLGRENKVTDGLFKEGIGTSGRYGEDFSEYYADLLGVVFRTANLSDPQTLRVLAFSSYNPDSQYARDLADAGGNALLPLAVELFSSDIAPKQWNALGLMGRLYEQRANHRFTPTTVQTIKTRIVQATGNANNSIKMEALRILGEVGTREDIPLLQRMAVSDPYVRRGSDGKPDRYLVRERAQEAISMIQVRFPAGDAKRQ